MKKLLFLLVLVFLAAASCKEKKTADYTILGMYTPYDGYMEKLNGKVKSITETNFWAIPEGETFVKGAKVTARQLDSLNYTGDFIARYDESGDIVSCTWIDENQNVRYKWEITKENNLMSGAKYTYNDTVRYYNKLKCDATGELIEGEVYNALTDTLMQKAIMEKNLAGDTVTYKYFNYKGELRNKVFYIYNTAGQLLGYQSYDKDGNYRGGDELTYDENGKISGIKFFDKDKNVTAENSFVSQLDAKGNPVSTICKDAKGFVLITERVYTYFD